MQQTVLAVIFFTEMAVRWAYYAAELLAFIIIDLNSVLRISINPNCRSITRKTGQNVELMGHPPYSPDLAPNDFFLFQHIKKKIRGQRFSLPDDAVEAFRNHGEYFEKQ